MASAPKTSSSGLRYPSGALAGARGGPSLGREAFLYLPAEARLVWRFFLQSRPVPTFFPRYTQTHLQCSWNIFSRNRSPESCAALLWLRLRSGSRSPRYRPGDPTCQHRQVEFTTPAAAHKVYRVPGLLPVTVPILRDQPAEEAPATRPGTLETVKRGSATVAGRNKCSKERRCSGNVAPTRAYGCASGECHTILILNVATRLAYQSSGVIYGDIGTRYVRLRHGW